MSEQNRDASWPPEPDHVVPGGVPDPVVTTAPRAEPATHDEARREQAELGAVFPVAGPTTGTVLPPVDPDRRA